jgi:hypothetical protein
VDTPNTGRQTAYTLAYVKSDNTAFDDVCVLCLNQLLPPSYIVMTAPYGEARWICERCIAIASNMLGKAKEKAPTCEPGP